MQHGELLYRLCAEMGVHYCDLTGESSLLFLAAYSFPDHSTGSFSDYANTDSSLDS